MPSRSIFFIVSRNQDDFSELFAFDDEAVGFGGVGEGEFEADDRAKDAGFESGREGAVDLAMLSGSGAEEHKAEDVGFAAHGVAGIDFDFSAAADDDDAAAFGEGG